MSQALRSQSITLGNNAVNKSENQLAARKGTVNTRSALGSQRAVLGEIGNRVKNLSTTSNVRAGQKQPVPAEIRKPLVRSKASSSIRRAVVPTAPTVPCKPEPASARPFSAADEADKLNAYSSKLLLGEDIDAEDADNPQLVSEYIKDIYLYLRFLEDKFSVRENHLRDSKITGKMREILIDWLVQVHQKFKLLHETLYLTVAIIDRFLQEDSSIQPGQLQMVGVTAMWIASKYEEIYAPEVNDFVVIADKSFDQDTMRAMERRILSTLNFDLGRPLPLHFLRRNSKAGCVDNRQHTLAKYLMELSLQECALAHCPVSQLAAAALCLALKVLEDEQTPGWGDALTHYSYYDEASLRPTMCRLAQIVDRANEKLSDPRAKRVAVARKYAVKKFLCISVLPELSGSVISELAAETS